MKLVSLVVAAVLIVGGIWFFVGRSKNVAPVAPTATTTPSTAKVEVTKTDITSNGGSSLPVGFPSDIPVETANISESFRAAYPSRGVVQYSVSYTSAKSRDALWDTYSSYMQIAGYTIDKAGTNKSLGQIAGNKGSNTLSVSVSEHSGLALVQINYLQR